MPRGMSQPSAHRRIIRYHLQGTHHHPFLKATFLLYSTSCDMANQSGSSRFKARFESALQSYQQTTGLTLAEHPLTVELRSCHSVDSITAILKREARASNDVLGSHRIKSSIESIVSMLSALSTTAPLGDATNLVRREALRANFKHP
jgi:hypothetical protein